MALSGSCSRKVRDEISQPGNVLGNNRLFWLVRHSPSKSDIVLSGITCLRIVLTASHTAKGSCCSYGESDAIMKGASMCRFAANSNKRFDRKPISQVVISGSHNL